MTVYQARWFVARETNHFGAMWERCGPLAAALRLWPSCALQYQAIINFAIVLAETVPYWCLRSCPLYEKACPRGAVWQVAVRLPPHLCYAGSVLHFRAHSSHLQLDADAGSVPHSRPVVSYCRGSPAAIAATATAATEAAAAAAVAAAAAATAAPAAAAGIRPAAEATGPAGGPD